MENNEKAQYFAQYHGQKVLWHNDAADYCPVGFSPILSAEYYSRNGYCLFLEPTSALPFKNYSVEQLIEMGWLKLNSH